MRLDQVGMVGRVEMKRRGEGRGGNFFLFYALHWCGLLSSNFVCMILFKSKIYVDFCHYSTSFIYLFLSIFSEGLVESLQA